jgi:hypothetical protein
MINWRKTTASRQEQSPKAGTTEEVKTFMNRLADQHDKFCDDCKILIGEALG